MPYKIFLLSPANSGGVRARLILSDRAQFDLACRVRCEGAPLGEVFSFVSGLYFRGKYTYSERFALPPPGLPGSVVITPNRGLVASHKAVTLSDLTDMASVPVNESELRYRLPLERDARNMESIAGRDCSFVLLGSVATAKYVEPLLDIFGSRLLFPGEFVGRGDMSRGGLLLRSASTGNELTYIPVKDAIRRGPRPPRLPRLRRGELS